MRMQPADAPRNRVPAVVVERRNEQQYPDQELDIGRLHANAGPFHCTFAGVE